MFGTNLVIPGPVCDKLSWEQDQVYGQTDNKTDGQTNKHMQRQYTLTTWKARGSQNSSTMQGGELGEDCVIGIWAIIT